MIVDSHCHLDYFPEESWDDMLNQCKQNGVMALCNVSVDLDKFENIVKPCKLYNGIYCSIGTHPCSAHDAKVSNTANHAHSDTYESLLSLHNANAEHIIAVGETGLDYFHDSKDVNMDEYVMSQKQSLEAHIQLASQTGKPLIIHSRDAENDTYDILKDAYRNCGITGVMHCFTGSKAFMFKMLDLGFYISMSGIVTFNNAKELQETALHIPLSNLLIETDSPYLCPVPLRGQKNQPANVMHVAKFMAKHLNRTEDEISNITTENFCNLFNVSLSHINADNAFAKLQ